MNLLLHVCHSGTQRCLRRAAIIAENSLLLNQKTGTWSQRSFPQFNEEDDSVDSERYGESRTTGSTDAARDYTETALHCFDRRMDPPVRCIPKATKPGANH